jgi:hypothetical protein
MLTGPGKAWQLLASGGVRVFRFHAAHEFGGFVKRDDPFLSCLRYALCGPGQRGRAERTPGSLRQLQE